MEGVGQHSPTCFVIPIGGFADAERGASDPLEATAELLCYTPVFLAHPTAEKVFAKEMKIWEQKSKPEQQIATKDKP